MKIFNAQTIKEIDAATCEAQKISSLELMDRAADAVACEVISRFLPTRRFVIFAGPGNNGGDALAVARFLLERGYKRVEVFLFNINDTLSADCKAQRDALLQIENVDFTEISHEFTPPYLGRGDVVIDGLFGSGLSRPLKGGFQALARYLNESGSYIISIDVPSGLFCEWNDGANTRDMVHANLTLAFQLPRLSFFMENVAEVLGEWKLLDIELDEAKIRATHSEFMVIEQKSVRPLLKRRNPFSAKRDYGSALLMAGSMGMMGAAALCAKACLRSGAGLATVHSARCGMNVLQTAVPEAMFEPDRNERFISDMKVHHNHQVVAVGPGIGTHDETVDALENLLKNAHSPLVLDADALNCIARRPSLLTMIPEKTIITPHAGEFDRLFGEMHSPEERLRKAIEAAKHYNIIIVLKGHYTAIIRPTGTAYFNMSGNAGMATAGAGDVLTGIIASFVAQGYIPEHAATISVFVHGLAGDMAAKEYGQAGLMAGDIADMAGRAIQSIFNSKQ